MSVFKSINFKHLRGEIYTPVGNVSSASECVCICRTGPPFKILTLFTDWLEVSCAQTCCELEQLSNTTDTIYLNNFCILAHLSRRLEGELLVYPLSGVRPLSLSSVVHNFKHEYLCIQWADHNGILSEASLGWGKGCRRFGARLDQNSCYAPNFEKVGDILVSACPYVCVSVCMYSCSRYRLETSGMDSSWKNSRRIFLVFPELSPLVKLRPFDKQGDEIL